MEKTTPTTHTHTKSLFSLSELCEALSISTATGRNWIKSGKLTPEKMIGRTPYFSIAYANAVIRQLQDAKSHALKSRRNKKYLSGNHIYTSYVSAHSSSITSVQQILSAIGDYHIALTQAAIAAILGECAVRLFLHDSILRYCGNCLEQYLEGAILLGNYGFLIDDLIGDKQSILETTKKYPALFTTTFEYETGEDTLGLLYLSIQDIADRKATGAYYTPTEVVQKLCQKLFERNSEKQKCILDPCCGTGNFLLQLPESIPFDSVYGIDIDPLCIKIARINMALKYKVSDKGLLYGHIQEQNYLQHDPGRKFDFIIGNPPWGYAFSKSEKAALKKKYHSAAGANIESYDIFLEQALSDLKLGGALSFVLPEALLNVKSHTPIRRLLLESCSFQYLDFLGNAFGKVQCPCVILQALHTGKPASCVGMEIASSRERFSIAAPPKNENAPESPRDTMPAEHSQNFTIQIEREIHDGCFRFFTTDAEYLILNKIDSLPNKRLLAGNAAFALGIVTGNNKKYLSGQKRTGNELVLKGSDLYKFRIHPGENYMAFQPASFQQTAPAEFYRAPEKLLYRFICSHLVFAYDDQQTLSLNSCNVLIPQIEGLEIKYILAILNSRTAQFYFQKQFHSVKILRSHIEQIPIPWIPKKQQQYFIQLAEQILAAGWETDIRGIYEELDQAIARLYGLDDFEYRIIQENMARGNLFLRPDKLSHIQ